jgi:lipopolysaccharide/colanic/teichoic acid biosynthesis glycosyltransferase
VVIAGDQAHLVSPVLRAVVDLGVRAEAVIPFEGLAARRLMFSQAGTYHAIGLRQTRRDGWRRTGKRLLDLGLAVPLLVLNAPIVGLAMLATWRDSGRPLIFRQVRVGEGGRLFTILKLRTMVPDAELRLTEVAERNEADGPLFKVAEDPRITRVGRVLRRLSIDELPQLWNVVRGDMSLVGPRPGLPTEARQWSTDARQRLRVRPGITGLWQVSGRSCASYADYVRHDDAYVENWTFCGDLVILARTARAVLAGHGSF